MAGSTKQYNKPKLQREYYVLVLTLLISFVFLTVSPRPVVTSEYASPTDASVASVCALGFLTTVMLATTVVGMIAVKRKTLVEAPQEEAS
jgi:hypothetical protein